jgi:predicted nucleic acid-binding protein
MKADILADTSIWIEYFNKSESKSGSRLQQMLAEGKVCGAGIILTELLQGAKIEKEFEIILNNYTALPLLKENLNTWISAGKISYSLHRNGITLPTTDLLLAALALESNCKIFTLDQHFMKIPDLNLVDMK